MPRGGSSDSGGVPGVRIGHATSADGTTGVSVLRFEGASPTVVDVRGGASGTYDTASLGLEATFGRRWAIFLAGGSVFGLDAGAGVRDEILRSGGGSGVFGNSQRIAQVSGAILYDLPDRARTLPEYRALGAEATRAAVPTVEAAGRWGAGAGARIGKYLGRGGSQPGAVGLRTVRVEGVGSVASLVAVNSVGAVVDPETGTWLAGARGTDGRIVPPTDPVDLRSSGTTLVAVVTDVPISRPGLQRVAAFAHAGLARAVVPTHTSTDGDVAFASTVSGDRAPLAEARPGELADRIGMMAHRATVEAILAAARSVSGPERPRDGATASRGVRGSSRSS